MSTEYKCPNCNEMTTFNDRVCNKCGIELTQDEIEKVWELARWEKKLKMHQKDQIKCFLIGVISTIFTVLFWFIDGLAVFSVLFLLGAFIGFYFLGNAVIRIQSIGRR